MLAACGAGRSTGQTELAPKEQGTDVDRRLVIMPDHNVMMNHEVVSVPANPDVATT